MRTVALASLKDSLEECVGAASSGETVLVTDEDRVVAQIGPPPVRSLRSAGRSDDDWLAELERQGLVSRACINPGRLPDRQPIMPLSQILKELDADREDR